MIAYLTDWLKELISLVLLATIADMLLPDSKMQKYTKIVIGLFMIVTMLNPLLQFLKMENLPDKIMLDTYLFQKQTVDSKENLDLERLKSEQQKEMIQYLSQSIATSIEQELQEKFQAKTKVEVSISYPEDKVPKIDKLKVYFLGQVHKEYIKGDEKNGKKIEILPVAPIQIDESTSESIPVTDLERGETEQIRSYLEERFQLPPEKIVVMPGSSE